MSMDPAGDARLPEGASNPFLFVVGCPRSGTTLLQRMLDAHPLLAVANDTHFVTRALEKARPDLVAAAAQGSDPELTPELARSVRSYHRFRRLGVSPEDAEAVEEGCRTYGEYVSALFDAFARSSGKPLAGEKTPDYVRRLRLLHGLFPRVRTIHIIRDGREVALSLMDWATEKKGPGRLPFWKTDALSVSALWWRWQVSSGRRAGRSLGPGRYHEVLYRDLVAEPEKSLRAIAAFLGLPYSERMLAYHEGKRRHEEGLSAKKAWLPPTRGLRKWRERLSREDVQVFEILAGDLLQELGFETGGETPSAAARRRALAAQQWWEEHRSGKSGGGGVSAPRGDREG